MRRRRLTSRQRACLRWGYGSMAALATILCVCLAAVRPIELEQILSRLQRADLSPTLLERWRSNSQASQNRRIADSGVTCFKDRFSIEGLRAEVTRLESEWTQGATAPAPFVGKSWYGVDLSKQSLPQRLFAARSEGFLGMDLMMRSFKDQCSDVPCVLSGLYNDQSGAVGLLLYGWFLQTGSILAMGGEISESFYRLYDPDTDVTSTVSSLRFTAEELMRLWTVASLAPESFRRLPHFVVHKIQSNYSLDTETEEEIKKRLQSGMQKLQSKYRACALTLTGSAGDRILIHSECLSDKANDPVSLLSGRAGQYSTWAMLHEMTHLFDFSRANYPNGFSTHQESGWAALMAKNPQIVASDYVSSTGGVMQEDFAESLPAFRLNTPLFVKRSADRANLISKYFFDSTYFGASAELLARYQRIAQKKISLMLLDAQAACGADPDCWRERSEAAQAQALVSIRRWEPEACDTLGKTGNLEVLQRRLAQWSEKESTELRQTQKISLLMEKVDPKEAVLECLAESDVESCFSNSLNKAFAAAGASDSERKVLIERISYSQLLTQVEELTRDASARAQVLALLPLQKSWESCFQAARSAMSSGAALDSAEALAYWPVTGGLRFVAAPLLNCVNAESKSLAEVAVGVALNGQEARPSAGLTHALAKRVTAIVGAAFQREIDAAAAREESEIKLSKARLLKKLETQAQDTGYCTVLEKAAWSDTVLKEVLFANPKELIDAWIKDACHG